MQRLECTVTIEVPENPSLHVITPQFVMLWSSPSEATVEAYFMENSGFSIVDPHAVYSGPDISLRYSVESPSGAVAAVMSLRKIVYQFRGLTQRKYEFAVRCVKSNKALQRTR